MRLKLFIILICYFSEVTVKADMSADLPAKCSLKRELLSDACSVKSVRAREWRVDGYKVYVSNNSVINYIGSGKFDLIKGSVWIKGEDSVTLNTPFGEAKVVAGDVYATRTNKNVIIKSLFQTLKVTPKGGESFDLEPGFQITIGKVDARGVASVNFPILISYTKHLKEWSEFYPSTSENFTEDSKKLAKVIVGATKRAQEINSWLYQSRVDYLTNEHRKKVQAQANKIDLNNALIKLFRKKSNYE